MKNCNSFFSGNIFINVANFQPFLSNLAFLYFQILAALVHIDVTYTHKLHTHTHILTVTATYCPTRCCTWPSLLPSLDLLLGFLSLYTNSFSHFSCFGQPAIAEGALIVRQRLISYADRTIGLAVSTPFPICGNPPPLVPPTMHNLIAHSS